MNPPLQKALMGLKDYDLLGPFAVVEALLRLERIARAAAQANLTSKELRVRAQEVMDEHWVADGLPMAFLNLRSAEVVLRLDIMLEELQRERQEQRDQKSD